MKALIVGGGQLGRALQRALGPNAGLMLNVPWHDEDAARTYLIDQAGAFAESVGSEPWLLCWSAGVGVVGTPETSLALERRYLSTVLEAISSGPLQTADGQVFLASSAGGLYGSGEATEKTERSTPSPTSAYGHSKVLQERTVEEWSRRTGVTALIGRISNLYGPQQNLGKPQGFISHLCRAMLMRRSFTLTVPSHTIRDFIYTDDVARRVVDWSEIARAQPGCTQSVKLLVSSRSVTLGRVISMTRAISNTPTKVLFASAPASAEQPRALRFRSEVLPEIDAARPARTLEEGILATWTAAVAQRTRSEGVT